MRRKDELVFFRLIFGTVIVMNFVLFLWIRWEIYLRYSTVPCISYWVPGTILVYYCMYINKLSKKRFKSVDTCNIVIDTVLNEVSFSLRIHRLFNKLV